MKRPFTQNVFTRSVLFVRVNPHLVEDFLRARLVDVAPPSSRSSATGDAVRLSPRRAARPPTSSPLRRKYKTAYEIPQKALLDMALDRGTFVCQSQSFNAWFKNDVTYQEITSFHFRGWEGGAKTCTTCASRR